jgi:hypothetical protein
MREKNIIIGFEPHFFSDLAETHKRSYYLSKRSKFMAYQHQFEVKWKYSKKFMDLQTPFFKAILGGLHWKVPAVGRKGVKQVMVGHYV